MLSFPGCGILLRSALLCVEGGEEVFEMILKWESLDVDNDHHQQESSFQIIDTAGLRQSEFEKLKLDHLSHICPKMIFTMTNDKSLQKTWNAFTNNANSIH